MFEGEFLLYSSFIVSTPSLCFNWGAKKVRSGNTLYQRKWKPGRKWIISRVMVYGMWGLSEGIRLTLWIIWREKCIVFNVHQVWSLTHPGSLSFRACRLGRHVLLALSIHWYPGNTGTLIHWKQRSDFWQANAISRCGGQLGRLLAELANT